ncbi:MAG TPA: efflux RND transporter periplasmic adaptor subunit [Candidatus Acidoferrales bacterium]|jgi:RND family efflux transporter MFP subunit|nr:efflux RND transporter periplasmic adaptor subunit [Candidatus Acidoferrales bacterium]
MNQNFVRPLLIALTATVAAGFVTGCSHAAAQSQPPSPPSVTVAAVQQKEIVEWSEFTGRTEPIESVEIRPRVSGYIQEVRFQSGQLVNKGDVLFVIDPRWNQAAYDQRLAVYEQAKSENDRTENLLKNNAISKEEAGARQARYLAAKADLDSAKLDLEYTQVRAPISGRVSRALLTEGNYVSGIAGASSLLTTLVSVNPVYVYATIDEDAYLKYNNLVHAKTLDADSDGHVPVELQLADETEFSHQGYIESFDNRLDPNTGSILVRAVFTNENDRLVPGLFAHIRIPLSERHEAVLVDERAIGTDQAQKFVLTITPTNTVAYRQVQLGPLNDGKRIVRSGLTAGERIVVNGLQRVRPGMPVTPEPEAFAKSPSPKLAQR